MSDDGTKDDPPVDVSSDEEPRSELRAPTIPVHPGRWLFRTFVASGGSAIVGAVAAGLTPSTLAPAVAFAACGSLFVGMGLHGLRRGPGIQLVNAAQNQASMGRFDVAHALLDRAERSFGNAVVRRDALAVRASIALEQGDPDAALAFADRALAIEAGILTRQVAWMPTLSALSIRAYCRAVTGDVKGSREDKARIDQLTKELRLPFPGVVPSLLGASGVRSLREILARAELSTAVLLAHEGDRATLRAHLDEHHALLTEATGPRERALVRGFSRMLAAPSSTAYRRVEAARPASDAPSGEDWMERVLPEVAPFVRAPEVVPTSDDATTAVPATATNRVVPIDWGPARRIALGVGMWIFLLLAIVALWVVTGQASARVPNVGLVALSMALPVGFLVMLLGFSLLQARTVAKRRKRLFDDLCSLARDPEHSRAALTSLEGHAGRHDPLLSGQALLALVQQKNREGSFEEAAALATRAIAPLERRLMRTVSFTALVPALETERALAHAALGRIDDAVREVESLTEDYALRARSIFSVKLVAFAHEGAFAEACELIETSQVNAALDRPVEILADMIRATHSRAGLGLVDRQRLRNELDDAGLRSWLESAAPLALEAFEAHELAPEETSTGVRVVSNDAPAAEGAISEDDQAIEELAQEAEAEPALQARLRL